MAAALSENGSNVALSFQGCRSRGLWEGVVAGRFSTQQLIQHVLKVHEVVLRESDHLTDAEQRHPPREIPGKVAATALRQLID